MSLALNNWALEFADTPTGSKLGAFKFKGKNGKGRRGRIFKVNTVRYLIHVFQQSKTVGVSANNWICVFNRFLTIKAPVT